MGFWRLWFTRSEPLSKAFMLGACLRDEHLEIVQLQFGEWCPVCDAYRHRNWASFERNWKRGRK